MLEILAIIAIYFTGVAVFGAVPINSDFEPASDGVRLCVRTNGVHADIVVPSVSEIVDWQIQHPLQHFSALTTPYDHIAFGWGDRGFYLYAPTWNELTVGTALTAVSGLGSAALHVEYIDIIASDETTACTRISSEQYRVLAEYNIFVQRSKLTQPVLSLLLMHPATLNLMLFMKRKVHTIYSPPATSGYGAD